MSNTLTAKVELRDGMAFRATSGDGHAMMMDAKPAVGGTNRGPLPMEVVLEALGGCSGMDVISMLRKMRQDVTGYEIRLTGERVDTQPAVFTTIALEHVVRGHGVQPSLVARAIELSATKYCSVGAMLKPAVRIENHYRIIEEATGEEFAGSLEPVDAEVMLRQPA